MTDNKSFIDGVEVKKTDRTRDIVKKIKRKVISVQDLTETQKKEVCLFLENELIRKKIELNVLKNEVLYNREKKNNASFH